MTSGDYAQRVKDRIQAEDRMLPSIVRWYRSSRNQLGLKGARAIYCGFMFVTATVLGVYLVNAAVVYQKVLFAASLSSLVLTHSFY